MYKIVIVDDEEEVRTGIVNKIDWGLFGFCISGQAENGREALDIIEEEVPDVVITDITMPIMDGLELTNELRERYPTVKTVILTGFDDFRFAQQAIRYGVSDYLLKPVLPTDINELIAKLRSQLDSEFAQREDVDRLRRHYEASLPVMKEKFLSSLVLGIADEAEARAGIENFGLRLRGSRFVAASARIDCGRLEGNALGMENGVLARIAVLNSAREILDRHALGEAFFHEERLALLAGFDGENRPDAVNRMFALLEEIRQTVQKYLGITAAIGLGSFVPSLGRIRQSYRDALSAVEYSAVMGGDKVVYLEDVEGASLETISFDEEKERMLSSVLKFGGEKETAAAVETLFKGLRESRVSMMEYRLYLMEMLAVAVRTARAYQMDIQEMLAGRKNLYEDFFGFGTPEEAREWFLGVCLNLMRQIAGSRQNSTKILMEKARDYIARNYSDNSLSMQKLADHLHISACYLGMIFKKESGETFLRYLVGVRMEAAKQLLAGSDLKSTEIAERIGYPDINYFSYFFKKNLGVSPREYRASIKSREERGT